MNASRIRVRLELGGAEHVLTLDEALAVRRRLGRAIREAEKLVAREWASGCRGHETTTGPIGAVTYCDGTCRPVRRSA